MFQCIYRFRHRLVRGKRRLVPVSMGLSHADVRRSSVIRHCVGVMRRGKVPFSYIPIRLARATALGGIVVESFARGLMGTKFTLRVSSFNSKCSSLVALDRLPFGALGVSGDLVSYVRRRGKEVIIRRIVVLTRKLNVGIITRNIRATSRIRLLGRVRYSGVRKFCCSEPLPGTRFIGGSRRG